LSQVIVTTYLNAPAERCFNAARSIDLHTQTVWKHTREQAINGVTSGLIGWNESVTFEAVHFGIRQRLTSKITEYDYPHSFTDQMQKGAFRQMKHVHRFKSKDAGTLMTDELNFSSPLGPLGRLFDALVLGRYMRQFLISRNAKLKEWIESGEEFKE
jgi:ligand-binding SRPBCC domain-containing protein